MKSLLLSLIILATPFFPGARAAELLADRREPPRIVFGESEATDFEFRPFKPLRRSHASSRQAYFGSGEEYSEVLARLQDQLQRMTAHERLEGLSLSPAQEAAKEEMSPALLRALSLSQRARQDAGEGPAEGIAPAGEVD